MSVLLSQTAGCGCPSFGGRGRLRKCEQASSRTGGGPGPASTQRLRYISSLATAAIGLRPMPTAAWAALVVCARLLSAGVANAALLAQAWRAMTANPSIERTSQRLRLCAAAHVER
jgi:hypothetical protein